MVVLAPAAVGGTMVYFSVNFRWNGSHVYSNETFSSGRGVMWCTGPQGALVRGTIYLFIKSCRLILGTQLHV